MNAPEFQSVNMLTGATADRPLHVLIATAQQAVNDVFAEFEQLRAERDALRAEVAELHAQRDPP